MTTESWIVKESYLGLKAGDVVYQLKRHDYGSARDDSEVLGEKCISVSKTEDGDYPFTTVPIRLLDTASLRRAAGET